MELSNLVVSKDHKVYFVNENKLATQLIPVVGIVPAFYSTPTHLFPVFLVEPLPSFNYIFSLN